MTFQVIPGTFLERQASGFLKGEILEDAELGADRRTSSRTPACQQAPLKFPGPGLLSSRLSLEARYRLPAA